MGPYDPVQKILAPIKIVVSKASGKGRKNAREEVCRKMLQLLNENPEIPKVKPKDEVLEKVQ